MSSFPDLVNSFRDPDSNEFSSRFFRFVITPSSGARWPLCSWSGTDGWTGGCQVRRESPAQMGSEQREKRDQNVIIAWSSPYFIRLVTLVKCFRNCSKGHCQEGCSGRLCVRPSILLSLLHLPQQPGGDILVRVKARAQTEDDPNYRHHHCLLGSCPDTQLQVENSCLIVSLIF